MLTGEVKLLSKVKESLVTFDSLEIGEGIVSNTGVRIKAKHNAYLHFTPYGLVFLNCKTNWPPQTIERVGKFRLIAEEI